MMSSAETLNFGPEWLRNLSEGSNSSATSPPASQTIPISKFKLAENRYGREELLALFVEDSEVPEELHRAPSLVSEIVQIPLAIRPSNDHLHGQLSTSYRGRGVVPSGLRGRSIPSRGRGRGRGSAWVDQDDGPLRRPPLLRRSESEDWRSDSLRGKGDGAEDIMGGLKEWRVVGGQRNDFWKDAWRDRQGDTNEPRYPRGRSLSSRETEDSDRRRREDGFEDGSAHLDHLDSMRESQARGSEPSKAKNADTKEKREQSQKDGGTYDSSSTDDQMQASNNIPSNEETQPDASTRDTLPERPLKSLEPVLEAGETQDTGPEVDQYQGPPKERTEQAIEDGKKNLEDMFQKLSANDPVAILGKSVVPPAFDKVQRSEPQATSLGGPATQSLSFSANAPLQDIPITATSNSPIAQLQALATTWYYKDPQGDIQGPFSSNQMMEWFNAGYFTMILLVKRACDTEFTQLGELIKRWGHVPFASPPKPGFPNVSETDGTTSSILQQKYTEQQQRQMQYSKLLQSQQHEQPQIHNQQQHNVPKPAPIGSRTYQQHADLEMILTKLVKNPDFCRLSTEHQQLIVLRYAEELKCQSMSKDSTQPTPIQPPVANGAVNLHNPMQSDALQQQASSALFQQQKLLEEARKKEEEEIRRIQKQQEEQKELLRKQEEEFQRNKEKLLREQEEIKQLQLEAQRKKEELQLKIQEDERLQKMREMEELERRRKLEEEERRRQVEQERREAEMRRIQGEEERKRREVKRKKQEEEEERRRVEQQRQEELKRLEMERENQRLIEERRRQEEQLLAKEEEMQRKAEAARIQKEKEAEAKALLKKQQQEKQMQQMQLPTRAKWAHTQPQSSKNDSLSLVEIQKIEKREELTRLQEEARMVREIRSQVPKPKSGWGTPSQEVHGVSLLDIQREEAKQMSITKQVAKPEKAPVLNFNTSWNKPPKIQPDVPKPQPKSQALFWDQVVEENPKKSNSPAKQNQSKSQKQQHTQKQVKQQPNGAKQKTKGNEGQQIKALFQQQITKDSFTDWCEGYLKQMNAGSIDIPTFVNFLRDVESPYEVQEYVQSYLGESREAKDFTTLFLEERAKLGKHSYQPTVLDAFDKQRSDTRDTDGFEMVTASSKRGKKKLKKLQKVDPSILGFSVNAASDRVNMGEIQTADD